jgi:hypothetical protein
MLVTQPLMRRRSGVERGALFALGYSRPFALGRLT